LYANVEGEFHFWWTSDLLVVVIPLALLLLALRLGAGMPEQDRADAVVLLIE
jgi:hypothetical protein